MFSRTLVIKQSYNCLKPCKSLSTTAVFNIIIKEHPVWPDAEKHYGFEYYRRPGQVDPKIEPSKLFMVQRIKKLKGEPKWVKEIIEKLKLDTDQVDKAIVKNVPEMNAMLWTVKHVVKITPITFPYGEPKEGDKGYLNDKGQYILIKKIGGDIDEKRLETSHQFFLDRSRLDADTVKKKLRDIWLTSRK